MQWLQYHFTEIKVDRKKKTPVCMWLESNSIGFTCHRPTHITLSQAHTDMLSAPVSYQCQCIRYIMYNYVTLSWPYTRHWIWHTWTHKGCNFITRFTDLHLKCIIRWTPVFTQDLLCYQYQQLHSHVWVELSRPEVHQCSCCHRKCEGYYYQGSLDQCHFQTVICSSGSVWNSPPFCPSYNCYSVVCWVWKCVCSGSETPVYYIKLGCQLQLLAAFSFIARKQLQYFNHLVLW